MDLSQVIANNTPDTIALPAGLATTWLACGGGITERQLLAFHRGHSENFFR